jgi:hypothetical protein
MDRNGSTETPPSWSWPANTATTDSPCSWRTWRISCHENDDATSPTNPTNPTRIKQNTPEIRHCIILHPPATRHAMSCYVTCRMPRRSTPRSLLWWQARREVRVGKPGSFSSLPSENTRKRATEVHWSRPRSKFWKFSGTSIPVLPWSVTDCLCRPYGLRLAKKRLRLLPVSAPCNSLSQVLAVFIHSNCCCEIAPWDTDGQWTSADIWIGVCAKKGRRARSWHISRRKMLLHFLSTISTMGMFKNRAAVVRDIAVFLVRQTSKPVFRTSQHLPQMHWNAITPVFLVHIPQHPQKPWKSIWTSTEISCNSVPLPVCHHLIVAGFQGTDCGLASSAWLLEMRENLAAALWAFHGMESLNEKHTRQSKLAMNSMDKSTTNLGTKYILHI